MKKESKTVYSICEENVCPLCGNSLEYGSHNEMDDGGTIEWECPKCGATGKEGYDTAFDGNHYNVEDGDGNPVIIQPPKGEIADVLTEREHEFILFALKTHVKAAGDHYGNLWCASAYGEKAYSREVKKLLRATRDLAEIHLKDAKALDYILFAISEYEDLRQCEYTNKAYGVFDDAQERKLAEKARSRIYGLKRRTSQSGVFVVMEVCDRIAGNVHLVTGLHNAVKLANEMLLDYIEDLDESFLEEHDGGEGQGNFWEYATDETQNAWCNWNECEYDVFIQKLENTEAKA